MENRKKVNQNYIQKYYLKRTKRKVSPICGFLTSRTIKNLVSYLESCLRMDDYLTDMFCTSLILFTGILTTASAVPVLDRSKKCELYKTETGLSCYPCQEGSYKVADCVEYGHQAVCAPCPNGTYQTHHCSQGETCAGCKTDCSHLSDFMEVEEKCTFISDIKCRCILGYYWSKSKFGEEKEGMCLPHKNCKPGEGVKSSGTRTENVKCQPCTEGTTYSNTSSPNQTCTLCTRCEDIGFDTVQKCNVTNDSVCGLIERPEGTSMAVIASVSLVLFVIALPITVGAVWYRWKAKLCKGSFRKDKNFWNKFFQELAKRIPWDKFKIFFRELMWEIVHKETSKLIEEEIETMISHAEENYIRDTQERQFKLLLQWRSTCEKNGIEARTEQIECALETAEIDIKILQDILPSHGVIQKRDYTDSKAGEDSSLVISVSESNTSSVLLESVVVTHENVNESRVESMLV